MTRVIILLKLSPAEDASQTSPDPGSISPLREPGRGRPDCPGPLTRASPPPTSLPSPSEAAGAASCANCTRRAVLLTRACSSSNGRVQFSNHSVVVDHSPQLLFGGLLAAQRHLGSSMAQACVCGDSKEQCTYDDSTTRTSNGWATLFA